MLFDYADFVREFDVELLIFNPEYYFKVSPITDELHLVLAVFYNVGQKLMRVTVILKRWHYYNVSELINEIDKLFKSTS